MKLETYTLTSESHLDIFKFISEGPKGAIHKLIHFQKTDEFDLYNLAFGDKDVSGEIDDLAVSDNGDAEKVLATVVEALYIFFDRHPNAFVYAKGSTPSRTRLYRIGIHKFYREATEDFDLFGQSGDNFYEFERGYEHDAFLVQRNFK